jgi:tricorn protease-like protein
LQLKPDRKIEFTTDEGTWLSLDVSPDGKTIVFELVGDIYTLPIEGGQAKLIDGGMAFDSQPKFSPDGKWIAFLSDRWEIRLCIKDELRHRAARNLDVSRRWWLGDSGHQIETDADNSPPGPAE